MNSNKFASPVTQDQKIFVLVHGGAQGAWAFGKLAWLLAADGHHVIARDLPGNGLRARLPRSYLERPFDRAITPVEDVHRVMGSAVDRVVLMWFGGFGVRGLLDGVTVAMSVMAAALPVPFAVVPGKAA